MRKKLWILIGAILICGALVSGCTKSETKVATKPITPVKVEEIKESIKTEELYYTGIIVPGEMRNLGFKTPGIIEDIFVAVGDVITENQPLAKLDTSDIEFGLRAAISTYNGASAQYSKALNGASTEEIQQVNLNETKAKEAYELAKITYSQIEALYEEGAVSKSDYQQAKTQMEVHKATYEQALSAVKQAEKGARSEDIKALKSQKNLAQVDVDRYEKMLEDTVIVSPFSGYVVTVLFDSSEMTDAGYPVVVVRNNEIIANIGVSAKDINTLSIGQIVRVISGDKEYIGNIKKIGDAPDQTTLLYTVEIGIDTQELKVGSIVEVKIPSNETHGIWIPLQYIRVDSTDYVYVIEENLAFKKPIRILDTLNDYALVEGLKEGQQMVVVGYKQISGGDTVRIVEDS